MPVLPLEVKKGEEWFKVYKRFEVKFINFKNWNKNRNYGQILTGGRT
jgi:hypothetical protein